MAEKAGRGLVKMGLDEAFELVGGDLREVVLDDEVREDEEDSEGEWSDEGMDVDQEEDEQVRSFIGC